MTLSALYIPTGPVDPLRARDQVLNVSRSVSVVFARERTVHVVLPIRNDAFLQNGAHFLLQVACQILHVNLKCRQLIATCGLLSQTMLKKEEKIHHRWKRWNIAEQKIRNPLSL